MVILKVKLAAALYAPAAVSVEDGSANFTENGLPLPAWRLLSAFIDVKQHVSSVQALSGSALTVSYQRLDVPL